MLRSFWPLLLVFPLLVGCDGWELFPSDAPALGSEPYLLSILNAESCPLPDGLDPKAVSIASYYVRLRGQHAQKVPVNYFYASLLTSDGSRYLADFPGCDPLLSAPPVGPGQTAQGYLNFPVPPGKVPEKLVYAPALTGDPEGDGVVELHLSPNPPEEPEAP